MSEILTFTPAEVVPDREAVFQAQGIPPGTTVAEEVDGLYGAALDLLVQTVVPAGLLGELSRIEFAAVYAGEGRNEALTPVGDLFGRAESLALFTVTLGPGITAEIDARFRANDFALGCMLDAAASAAAEHTADAAERCFRERRVTNGSTGAVTLRYSPGYCGWDLSGQRKLFEFLRPEGIGVSLRESFLMEPLKSISGVIISGPRDTHDFAATYAFCGRCETKACRARLRALSPA